MSNSREGTGVGVGRSGWRASRCQPSRWSGDQRGRRGQGGKQHAARRSCCVSSPPRAPSSRTGTGRAPRRAVNIACCWLLGRAAPAARRPTGSQSAVDSRHPNRPVVFWLLYILYTFDTGDCGFAIPLSYTGLERRFVMRCDLCRCEQVVSLSKIGWFLRFV